MKKIIAVVGDAVIEKNGPKYNVAVELGKALVDNGYRVQTGGRGGVMEATFLGVRSSSAHTGNEAIAINPFFDKNMANQAADIIISTGLDLFRNTIVANADAVIAVGGGAGTMSEMGNAWTMGKMIMAYDNVDGWSSRLAGSPIDHRKRYKNIPDDRVYAVKNAADVINLLNTVFPKYTENYKGLMYKD